MRDYHPAGVVSVKHVFTVNGAVVRSVLTRVVFVVSNFVPGIRNVACPNRASVCWDAQPRELRLGVTGSFIVSRRHHHGWGRLCLDTRIGFERIPKESCWFLDGCSYGRVELDRLPVLYHLRVSHDAALFRTWVRMLLIARVLLRHGVLL